MQKYDIQDNGSAVFVRPDLKAIENDSFYKFEEDISRIINAHPQRAIIIDATSFPEHGDWSKTRLDYIASKMADFRNVHLKALPAFKERYYSWFGELMVYDEKQGISLKPASDAAH